MVDVTITDFTNGVYNSTADPTLEYGALSSILRLVAPYFAIHAGDTMFASFDDDLTDRCGAQTITLSSANLVYSTTTPYGIGKSIQKTVVENSYIQVADSNTLSPNDGDFTLLMWVKIPDNSTNSGTLYAHSTATAKNNVWLLSGGTIRVYNREGADNNLRDSLVAIDDNAWHLVAYTYTAASNTINIYIDGALSQGAQSGNNDNHVNPAAIVAMFYDVGGATSPLPNNSYIDEVRVLQYLLSAEEILAFYNAGVLYGASGDWTSEEIAVTAGKKMLSFKLTHSGCSETNYIDKVEFSVGGVVKATYGTNITSGTSTTITQASLTSGTFNDVVGTIKVKIYIVSDGTGSPAITQLDGTYITSVSPIKLFPRFSGSMTPGFGGGS